MPRTLTIAALTVICAACALAQVAEPIISGPPPVEELAAEAERLEDQERHDEMKAISLRMVTHYPDDARSWYWRGRSLSLEGEAEQACEAYDRALEIDPGMIRVRMWTPLLAGAIDGQAAMEAVAREVADYCAGVLEDDPDNRDALWVRAWAFHRFRDRATTREILRRAVELYPEDAELLHHLAVQLTFEQQWDEARQLMERSLEINPNRIATLRTLHSFYFQQDRYHEALAITERMKRVNPMQENGYTYAALTLAEMGDLEAAMEQCDIALALEPDASHLWTWKANILRRKGSPEDALAVLDEAVKAGIEPEKLHMARGNCYRNMDRLEDAVAEYTRAIEAGRSLGHAYLQRAKLQMKLGNYEEAWADLDRADEQGVGSATDYVRDQLRERMPEPEREGEG